MNYLIKSDNIHNIHQQKMMLKSMISSYQDDIRLTKLKLNTANVDLIATLLESGLFEILPFKDDKVGDKKKAKEIFQKLAKKIHPDVSDVNPELFKRAAKLYDTGDCSGLEDMFNSLNHTDSSVEEIKLQVHKLQEQLSNIIRSDDWHNAFLYNNEVTREFCIEQHRKALQKQVDRVSVLNNV